MIKVSDMKRTLFIAFVLALVLCGCGKTSVVMVFDKPVGGYSVSGVYYPFDRTSETGQVELKFIPENGGDTLVFSNVGCFEEDNPKSPSKFTGKNICDFVRSENFSGFHNGDTIVCHYYYTRHPDFGSQLLYDAEFQFIDIDFDGQDEFLINDYSRTKSGNHYTAYEIGPDDFVLKDNFPFNCLTNETILYPEEKRIYLDDRFGIVDISHMTASVNYDILDIDNISQEYVGTVHLYYDDGPYTDGPEFSVDTLCWVYRYSTTTMQGGVPINEKYTYYFPMGQTSIILRSNTFSGQGYHGGHMIILKDDTDSRFSELRQIFNGKRLVHSKKDDIVARAFENYCTQSACWQGSSGPL